MKRARWFRQGTEPSEPSELEELRPFLELAREIRAEVDRIAADPTAHPELLVELLERIPGEKRMEVARAIFDALPAERQWEVLTEVYGDDELRAWLEEERATRVADAERLALARRVSAEHRLDTGEIEAGEVLTLGLFREHDVRPALRRGHTSSTCARQLVLRAAGDGSFRVIHDTFNPNGGYFVTAEYSEDTWRNSDRLAPHDVVRIGSISGGTFEPVVYPGGRVDFETDGRRTQGVLHLGFAMLGDIDILVSE